MTRNIIALLLLSLLLLSACEDDYPCGQCRCHDSGNSIEGWEYGNDSTIAGKRDSVGGFAVTVDEWGRPIQKDVPL